MPRSACTLPPWTGRRQHRFAIAGCVAIALAALVFRTIRNDSQFTSSDQVQLAYHVSHEWGYGWLLRMNYGPLQPLLTKLWALFVTTVGVPMTESMWRFPMALVGSLLPLFAYLLVRRLSDSRIAAWTAAVWTVVLPPLVSDARYLWAYETLGATCAVAALWTLMRYLDHPSGRRAWTFGALLAAYVLSHLVVHAVPIIIVLLVIAHRSGQSRIAESDRSISARWAEVLRPLFHLGVLLPVAGAACLVVFGYATTGGGPIGRMLAKVSGAAAATQAHGPAALLAEWFRHFGWLGGPLILGALPFGLIPAIRTRGPMLAIWAWPVVFAAPLFAIGCPTGRPTQYLTQASVGATIWAAIALIPWLERRIGRPTAVSVAGLVALVLAVGSVEANFRTADAATWTGVTARWGAPRDNPGYKSAAWYVRRYTGPERVVATLHDVQGLEWMPAAYYVGRACICFGDLTPDESAALFERYRDRVDVLVVERCRNSVPELRGEFRHVATVTDRGRTLVDIFARPALGLPTRTLDVREFDPRFDYEFAPRRIGQPLLFPPGTPPLRELESAVRELRAETRNSSS